MNVLRMTIPLNLQVNGINCTALWDQIKSDIDWPDKNYMNDESFVLEWEREDYDDVDDIRDNLDSLLNGMNIPMDEEDDFSGITMDLNEDREDDDE